MSLSIAQYRSGLTASMSEREFLKKIIALAEIRGWLYYHTHDSRKSPPGFPDLVLLRDNALIFAELKTARGKVTREQKHWLDSLARARVRVCLWRPSDWGSIEKTLA